MLTGALLDAGYGWGYVFNLAALLYVAAAVVFWIWGGKAEL